MRIGILGAGQLGRMLALSGYPLGLSFTFLDPAADACAAPVGEHLRGEYGDERALAAFCERCDVATFEFENVPAAAAAYVAARRPLMPGALALETAQDRLSEKRLFDRLGIPVPPYEPVDTRDALEAAARRIGYPCVLKTRRLGYDGKGQAVLRSASDLDAAWSRLGSRALLLEGFVAFERELSCIATRGRDGATAFYPVTENAHRDGILRTSIPRPDDPLQALAQDYTGRVLAALDYTGVMAFEFFAVGGGLLANEIAPRVHNSGHWTFDGAACSQFENHLRAVAGLPLGPASLRAPCAMVNLIGTVPPLQALARIAEARVHLYGKEPKPGRKLGHVNVVAGNGAARDAALARVQALLG
ncbi:MAG TPA: 5-(carboxyamino)imidazole ribonucleotide synthase [Candidatus Binatia bacterium]|nr:5-(carboxyamino)imidazole ribonucleotide synthase [Candidatus Binatia bacterium]